MFQKLRALSRHWSEYRRFRSGSSRPRIVFYAEDQESWPYYEPIIAALTGPLGRKITYVTSSPTDPILTRNDPRIEAFCVGPGMMCITFFQTLDNALLVMTMPDLQTFHIKRSTSPAVHYLYIFHSMVSTHMTYRTGAFDHFDSVLCVGPHHVAEIRATEKIYGLKPKELFEHGYARLDAILADQQTRPPAGRSGPPRVLLAPSWGEHAILETIGEPVIEALLQAGVHLTVRPHPRTRHLHPQLMARLVATFGQRPNFVFEGNISSRQSLLESDVMISDWSGAALDYAFGLEKPVIFLDVPRKVNNPEYERLPMPPLEVSIREQLGAVIRPDDLGGLAAKVEEIIREAPAYRERLREIRARNIFNVGGSGLAGAQRIVEQFDRKFPARNG